MTNALLGAFMCRCVSILLSGFDNHNIYMAPKRGSRWNPFSFSPQKKVDGCMNPKNKSEVYENKSRPETQQHTVSVPLSDASRDWLATVEVESPAGGDPRPGSLGGWPPLLLPNGPVAQTSIWHPWSRSETGGMPLRVEICMGSSVRNCGPVQRGSKQAVPAEVKSRLWKFVPKSRRKVCPLHCLRLRVCEGKGRGFGICEKKKGIKSIKACEKK